MMRNQANESMAGFQPLEARIEKEKVKASNRPRRLRPISIGFAVVACAGFGFLIYSGIRSRTETEKKLAKNVKSTEAPFVRVIHPKAGSTAQEIELPGNTQAFTEAPIFCSYQWLS
jgi:hypothetical protein